MIELPKDKQTHAAINKEQVGKQLLSEDSQGRHQENRLHVLQSSILRRSRGQASRQRYLELQLTHP